MNAFSLIKFFFKKFKYFYSLCKEVVKSLGYYVFVFPIKFLIKTFIFFTLFLGEGFLFMVKKIVFNFIYLVLYLIAYAEIRMTSLKFIILKLREVILHYKKKRVTKFYFLKFSQKSLG